MSTEQEKELEAVPEPALDQPEFAQDPLEDTDRIQRAIEKVVDEETATLPTLPLRGIAETAEPTDAAGTAETADTDDTDHGDADDDDTGDADRIRSETNLANAEVHTWFFTFMCMNIPIVGWIYLFYLAFNKEKTERRNFARAYLFYKLVFLVVSAVILGLLIYIGIGFLNQLFAYMEML